MWYNKDRHRIIARDRRIRNGEIDMTEYTKDGEWTEEELEMTLFDECDSHTVKSANSIARAVKEQHPSLIGWYNEKGSFDSWLDAMTDAVLNEIEQRMER